MIAPIFLSIEDVLEAHEHQMDQYGGAHGVRDQGALASAVNMPKATFGGSYLHPDLFHMAAAYLFHIVQNHPSVDGNKRTGLYAALAFLEINEIEILTEPDDLAEFVFSIARGEVTKKQIVAYFRKHSHQVDANRKQ